MDIQSINNLADSSPELVAKLSALTDNITIKDLRDTDKVTLNNGVELPCDVAIKLRDNIDKISLPELTEIAVTTGIIPNMEKYAKTSEMIDSECAAPTATPNAKAVATGLEI